MSYGRYSAELFLELISIEVKIAVNSFASFSVGLIRSGARRFDSKINPN
jgi:hypothetical protein